MLCGVHNKDFGRKITAAKVIIFCNINDKRTRVPKIQTNLYLFVAFTCLLFVLQGCTENNQTNYFSGFSDLCVDLGTRSNNYKPDQKLDNCLIKSTKNTNVLINAKYIMAEQNNSLLVFSKKIVNKVWLEAENMNMGQIPIFLSTIDHSAFTEFTEAKVDKNVNTFHIYRSQLLVGLCAQPVMVWTMYIRYEDNTVEQLAYKSYWAEAYL